MVRYSEIIRNHGEERDASPSGETATDTTSQDPVRFSSIATKEGLGEKGSSLSPRDIELAGSIHSQLVDHLTEVRKQVWNEMAFDIGTGIGLVESVVKAPPLIEKLYQATIYFYYSENYIIAHMINALIYALKIGAGLQYAEDKLLELGTSALYYDIGLFRIPASITCKEEKLTEPEIALVRKHPEIGRHLLAPFSEENPWLTRVAFEHHERESGTHGYPLGIKGSEICEYAKIMGLVDTYEAMIHNRPHRKALSQHISVREMIKSKNLLFSPRIIKAFLEEMGLYPIGSFVRLNNKEIYEVVGTNKEHPMKPVVRLKFNSRGNPAEEENIIDLTEHPILYVKEAVDRDDLSL